ncbi:MAG: DUF5684 domain-containing protein, partial [Candidatus Pacebacteria bacterium]|nr:DUF5684 domain-containing protein [Candidatus Paceibacterota bacterium]
MFKKLSCFQTIIVSTFALFLIGGLLNIVSAQTLPSGGGSFETAAALQTGTYQGGTISENQQLYYSLQVKAGQNITIKSKFVSDGLNTVTLFNGNKEELVSEFGDNSIKWLVSSDDDQQKYYFKIATEGWPTDSFSLEISTNNYYDAGSQTDAGESFEKALVVTTGDYDGYLAAHPYITELVGNDLKDYYKISVSKGVTYEFKAMPPTGGAMKLETFNLNRELLEEKSSANDGAVAALSLTPVNNTNIYLAVSSDSWYGYIVKSADVLNYKLSIKTSVSLSKFYGCKTDNCQLVGEFATKQDCQITTSQSCYSTANCDGKCGGVEPPVGCTKNSDCSAGNTCVNGQCLGGGACQDECSAGATKCFDNFNYYKCGDYNKDSCFEWASPVYCGEGNKCKDGQCTKADGCQCSQWQGVECGASGCPQNQVAKVRVCTPAACDVEKICQDDSSCQNTPLFPWFGFLKGFRTIGLVFGGLYVILWALFYIYLAICLQILAKKTGTKNGWMAWIPVANVFLMLQIAQKPLWWFILLLIPIVNIIFGVLIWMAIAERRGKPNWVGILIIVPAVGIVIPGYLAFSGSEKIEITPPYVATGTEAANKPTVGYKHPCKYCEKLIPPNSVACPYCEKVNPLG